MIKFRPLERGNLAAITSSLDEATMKIAGEIVRDVKTNGEAAVRKYAAKFDGLADSDSLLIDRDDLLAANKRIPENQLDLLKRVAQRISTFASAQRNALSDCTIEIAGGRAGHRWLPLETAGCYAPAGRYPLPSSVLMTVITARVAGVKNVWVASPKADDILLASAAIAGADGFLVAGGAQAIAAMAYGLEDRLPISDVIVGPGNRFVTAAKAIVSQTTKIDMLAGPSELVVVAGEDADPKIVAADLLAQAEHDTDARPILITFSESFATAVEKQLNDQLKDLPTATVASEAIAHGGYIIASDLDDALSVCKTIAPEHLSLQGQAIADNAERFEFGAAVFIGSNTAEVYGDYGAGPNHVLPTGGVARSQGGLSVATFLKMQTQLQIDDIGPAKEIIEDARQLGLLEGLAAQLAARHATAEEVRVLGEMVDADDALVQDPGALSRANRRFHKQIHLSSHNRYLVQQLDLVYRSMALMATTSLAAEGRGEIAQAEHRAIVEMIAARDEEGAAAALRSHISLAFVTRLKQEAARREAEG